ncbi:uncharacterized protein BXZ73DRAFT_47886 [Epithele typhae]|uniref:uncharacterized protein n=1 Tax=Epithele typhae TaxID=378194 RepID=UPI002007AEC1|nr:uncharacterized protein BXZ73DRAFT_47886 [Epithele typhae]KAH9929581.1 hypothetical protein BXZ73DRAFT_47886 [Epithele typhae]
MSTTAAPPAAVPAGDAHANAPAEDAVSPQVQELRAMFPDFDVAVLQSVLESVNNDQERALDVLLGMSDPDYVSTSTQAPQHEPTSTDLDEALARQLMLEDQERHQARRHATGASWPRRDDEGQVPYQTRQHGQARPVPPEESRTDFQELQRTMGQIAESGKRTFSSIVSKVKQKINDYDQSRCVSSPLSGAGASTAPQWGGSGAQPAQVDRHTASQAYQQRYFGPSAGAESSPGAAQPTAAPAQGYTVDGPMSTPPTESLPIATAPRDPSPVPSGLTPNASPRPSSDVPRPPATMGGSPVNAAKIGLLPKRPVSLLNTNSPPATKPSDDDDDLEYVENPFEERK